MRSAVVTGAAGGIGSAVVERLVRDGWAVIATDRVSPSSHRTAVRFIVGDLQDRALPRTLADALAEAGTPTALVNVAAMPSDARLVDTDDALLEATLDVGLLAPFRLMRAIAPLLGADGAIVNVASVHAAATSIGAAAYVAAKGGLVALTRAAALELAPVRVNSVLPGAIDTPMLRDGLDRGGQPAATALADLHARTPLGRIGHVDEVASAIVWLLEATFVTGSSLTVDGGALARLSTE
ncbi:MAG: glucose 1-dehydrogenase [Myxococcota bacterium]|jgi:glucose 1-dehydrogenase